MDYPEIADGVLPRHRFMSAYEQRIEPPDKAWQYLLFAAEPYETISFKVKPSQCSSNGNMFYSYSPRKWVLTNKTNENLCPGADSFIINFI